MWSRQEAGQITVLIIGLAIILGLAVAVIVNASNVFLERRSLASWADGAVTAAAQQVSHTHLYGGESVRTLPLSEAAARQAVADYAVRTNLTSRLDDFAIVDVAVESGSGRVTVELAASTPFMLAGDLTSGLTSFRVTARSTAVVPLE
ncbi:pilus assembly protein TadG-related protein [Phytoactinopolyspora mesophila]|uniref:Putative Flp pilus-assembly TadG-like N-terminal domain-containing protein n=1 Tax=Phytoactinopolyspora mesophila TaxID=2650750 RepID=A0A7K3M5T4_9ACTN|nr:pilus assembly protein TadG-related protein [Phytoactinopolyspora mesophila]NDL58606.1 hypothetical protein [Phytoactinopolyspora mesophila]